MTGMETLPVRVSMMIGEAMRRGWQLRTETEDGGCFDRQGERVIFSICREPDGKFWLHVSMSRHDERLPTWADLVALKAEWCGDEATALMVIPPKSKHVNIHPGVHHIWQCLDGDVTPDFTHGKGTL